MANRQEKRAATAVAVFDIVSQGVWATGFLSAVLSHGTEWQRLHSVNGNDTAP